MYEGLDNFLTSMSNSIDSGHCILSAWQTEYYALFKLMMKSIRKEFIDVDIVQEWVNIASQFIHQKYYQIIIPLEKSIEQSKSDIGMLGLYLALKYELRFSNIMMIADNIPPHIAITQAIIRYLIEVCSVFELQLSIDFRVPVLEPELVSLSD